MPYMDHISLLQLTLQCMVLVQICYTFKQTDASTNIKSTIINITSSYGCQFTLGTPISTTYSTDNVYDYKEIPYIVYFSNDDKYYIYVMKFPNGGNDGLHYTQLSGGNIIVYYI